MNVAATLAKKRVKSGEGDKPASVLLVDLDPQSNASLTLLKKKHYEEIDAENKTLFALFDYELARGDSDDSFDLDKIRATPIDTNATIQNIKWEIAFKELDIGENR